MSEGLIDDLRQQIAGGNAVVIVGAGVSIGATKNQPCASWTGLLHNGVDRCVEVGSLKSEFAKSIHDQIHSGDLDLLLAAAETVEAKLGKPSGAEYSRWLRETVGALRAERREVIEALNGLGCTLATTNYDGLIEEVTGLPPVTWMDRAEVVRVLRGDDKGVLHLHGFWKSPDSVILGVRSYEKVIGDKHAQAVLHALQLMRTLVFVGCGEGLSDPNFGALLEWTGQVFAGDEYRRFRLCVDGEIEALRAKHPAEQRLFPIGFGEHHSALPGFLPVSRLQPIHACFDCPCRRGYYCRVSSTVPALLRPRRRTCRSRRQSDCGPTRTDADPWSSGNRKEHAHSGGVA
jgi:hypothetical protein